MSKELTFEETVKWVSKINKTLKSKGFDHEDIDDFWTRVATWPKKITEVGIENVKVCTGCGHLNIEPLSNPAAIACCPDNNYKSVKE